MLRIGRHYNCFILLFSLLFSTAAFANVTIELDTKRPIKGESFTVQFSIETDSSEMPFISFDPSGVEVQSKRNGGVMTSSVFQNGRLSTTRKIIVIYELLPVRSGDTWLRNIKVDVGDKEFSKGNFKIKVFNDRLRPKNFFVKTEVSKNEIYVGEKLDVNYYIYYRVPVVQSEVKKFPKFDDFLKRDFLRKKSRESVNIDGLIYQKELLYSVKLFPNSAGKKYIRPISLNIVYEKNGGNFPFGSSSPFFSGRRYSKTINSDKVTLNVLPLPTTNLPPQFTGLVGEHDFKIKLNKNKFLVNEAIEVELTIEGEGALERAIIPTLYSHDNLEEFNSTSEINYKAAIPNKKIEYVYLGRNQLNFENSTVEFYYFDPSEKRYKQKSVSLPGLIVSGGAYSVKSNISKANKEEANITSNIAPTNISIIAPVFDEEVSLHSRPLPFFITVLGLLCSFILLLINGMKNISLINGSHSDAHNLYKKIVKDGASYSRVYQLLYLLDEKDKNKDIYNTVADSTLNNDSKKYFKELLRSLESRKFSGQKKPNNVKVNKKMFKSLLKEIGETDREIT